MQVGNRIRALAIAALLAGSVSAAFGQVRVGTHAWAGARPVTVVRVHAPYRAYWGWGWGYPYGWGFWGGPWWYGPQSVDVRHIDYGAIDFDVKPLSSQVFIDDKFFGAVGDLKGRHHEAYLAAGLHNVRVLGPGGQKAEREIYVAAGQSFKFSHQFES